MLVKSKRRRRRRLIRM